MSTQGLVRKDLLIEWLNSHDRGLNPLQKKIFENIKGHLQFNSLNIEKRNNGENLIIIPIDTEVRTLLSANANYLQLDDKTIFNLMIVQNGSGKLRWSSIIAYLPKSGVMLKQLPRETIQHIINGENVGEDGIYKFINLKGRLQYAIHYEKGRLTAVGKPIREDALSKDNSKKITSIKTASTNCVAWYEVTTWYYSDGHSEVTEEYLFTTCNEDTEGGGGGGGGGGGDDPQDPDDPEDPNDQEIVVSGADEEIDYSYNLGDQHQPVQSDNPAEQERDADGNLIIPPIMPYPLTYRYPWNYAYKVIGPIQINWARAADTYPDPGNIDYPSPLGQITRNVECFNHYNTGEVIGPNRATLRWNCSVNKRWSYHRTNEVEVRQTGLHHVKTITF